MEQQVTQQSVTRSGQEELERLSRDARSLKVQIVEASSLTVKVGSLRSKASSLIEVVPLIVEAASLSTNPLASIPLTGKCSWVREKASIVWKVGRRRIVEVAPLFREEPPVVGKIGLPGWVVKVSLVLEIGRILLVRLLEWSSLVGNGGLKIGRSRVWVLVDRKWRGAGWKTTAWVKRGVRHTCAPSSNDFDQSRQELLVQESRLDALG